MFYHIIFKRLWKTVPALLLAAGLLCTASLSAQPVTVRGSIGKALPAADSTKVVVYGLPSVPLTNVLFENINICVSIPDQGAANPQAFVYQNYLPSLDWTALGSNPEVIGGRAYYTFIGNDNESGTRVDWMGMENNPVVMLSFREGVGREFIQINDITDAGGIGSGGGGSAQSFWYVQANALGDITDYDRKFYQSPLSKIPLNGGAAAPSAVETSEQVALPVKPSPQNTAWLLFPNPTRGVLQLLSGATQTARLRIYNQLGQLAWEEGVNLNQAELTLINPGALPVGAYLFDLRGTDGQRLFVERFVVLRE